MPHPRARALQSLAVLSLSLVLFPTLALPEPTAPALVRDINPGLGPEERSGEPRGFVDIGGIVFFNSFDPAHGEEIWRTDGTEEGTWLVKDLLPGRIGSDPILSVAGDTLYLRAWNGLDSHELWKSDGTAAGTVPVLPGYDGPLPQLETGKTSYGFRGCGATGPCELWKSDGTHSGTVTVASLTPPPGAGAVEALGGSSGPLFYFHFYSQDGALQELWRSDDTEAGTFPLRRFTPTTPGPQRLFYSNVQVGGAPVLQRMGRDPGPGALEKRRHRRRHGPGQGGLSAGDEGDRGDGLLDRRGPGFGVRAVEERRHRSRHGPGQGHRARAWHFPRHDDSARSAEPFSSWPGTRRPDTSCGGPTAPKRARPLSRASRPTSATSSG